MTNQADDPIADARAAIIRAIAELQAANIAVPIALHLAVHALAYAVEAQDKADVTGFAGQGHTGAIR